MPYACARQGQPRGARFARLPRQKLLFVALEFLAQTPGPLGLAPSETDPRRWSYGLWSDGPTGSWLKDCS
jgi:hypothetical protein